MHISKFLNSFINSLPLVAKTGLYSDLSGKPTLGTASALDVGTTANKIIQLNESGQIPNLDGSLLQNVISSGASPSVPYSINSAKKDSNGYASFITKISNTEISFDTNSGSIPIVATYSDGSVETSNTLPNITGISTDGTYYIVKEKASNPYVTTLYPVESYISPTSPSANQLWLDLSVVPYIPKKWNGSSWVITQFVKLGEFVRASGVISTPISYALNAKAQVSVNYTDNFQSVIHNVGYIPKYLKATVRLRCLVAQHGFQVGEIAQFGADFGAVYSAATHNPSLFNNQKIGFGNLANLEVITSSNTAATPTINKWEYVFDVERIF
jgi:hypothetical protein